MNLVEDTGPIFDAEQGFTVTVRRHNAVSFSGILGRPYAAAEKIGGEAISLAAPLAVQLEEGEILWSNNQMFEVVSLRRHPGVWTAGLKLRNFEWEEILASQTILWDFDNPSNRKVTFAIGPWTEGSYTFRLRHCDSVPFVDVPPEDMEGTPPNVLSEAEQIQVCEVLYKGGLPHLIVICETTGEPTVGLPAAVLLETVEA